MRSGSVGDSAPLTTDPWQRLQDGAQWDDLVMPTAMLSALRGLPGRLSERLWSDYEGRPGLLAVFRGSRGTGKTLATRAVAAELQLPVFQANLARLTAGGASQSLRLLGQLFAAAQQAGAVLKLDGAEVLGSAGPAGLDLREVLRRCEAYPGLVVVSCREGEGAIVRIADLADVVLDFALPDAATRVEIWHRCLPADAEVGEGEIALLADGFPVSAGAIAAACAAGAEQAEANGVPLVLAHLTAALKRTDGGAHDQPSGRAAPAARASYRPAGPAPPRPVEPAWPKRVQPEPPRPVELEPARPVEPELPRRAEPAPLRAVESAPPPGPALTSPTAPAPEPVTTSALAPDQVPAPAAAQALPVPRHPPVGRRRALPTWRLATAVLGGLAALGLGLALAQKHHNASGAQVVLDRQVSTGPLRFSYPSSWSVQAGLTLPGLKLSDPVTVGSAKRPGGQFVIGTITPTSAGGLPAAFVRTLSGQPEPNLVSLGSRPFYRLLDSGLTSGTGGEAAYVMSSGGWTVVAECRAQVQAFAGLCERVLSTLAVTPKASTPPVLSSTYITGLNTILTSLAAARRTDLATLAAARTAAAQSKAAFALSQLHGKAAHAVLALPAGNAGHVNNALGRALINMANAYADLGRASARGLPRGYAKAQAEIVRYNAEVARELAALRKLGLQVA